MKYQVERRDLEQSNKAMIGARLLLLDDLGLKQSAALRSIRGAKVKGGQTRHSTSCGRIAKLVNGSIPLIYLHAKWMERNAI